MDMSLIVNEPCCGCGKKEGEPYHTCPFRYELEDDDTECNCCDDCTESCADDI